MSIILVSVNTELISCGDRKTGMCTNDFSAPTLMHMSFKNAKCVHVFPEFTGCIINEWIIVTLVLENSPAKPLLSAFDVEWKITGRLSLFLTSDLLECQQVHYTLNKQVCG